jgi:membrane protein
MRLFPHLDDVPMSFTEVVKRTTQKAIKDDVTTLAAQQAYFFFFALFPALLALISIASYFPVENLVGEVVSTLRRFAPPEVIQIITEQLQNISNSRTGGILTIAFLFTLWSSSNALLAMVTTLNKAYDIEEARPWWKVRPTALGLTVGLAIFILVSMALIILGPTIADYLAQNLGFGPVFAWTWKIVQWPIVFVLVAVAIGLVYYHAPDADQEWEWITPGSVVATTLWVLVSLGLKLYLGLAGSYSATYGVIGGVMVLMLWFYLSGLVILIGAELNAVIEHASPYGKAAGEKVPGEKRRIGAVARRWYQEKIKRHWRPAPHAAAATVAGPPPVALEPARPKPSDLLIGLIALVPIALKIGRDAMNGGRHDHKTAA